MSTSPPPTARWKSTHWLCVVLALLAAVSWLRGLQMARDRASMLQPARLTTEITLPSHEIVQVPAAELRFLALRWPAELPAARLALRQVFPERQLLRWLEAGAGSAQSLLLPLQGLEPGLYWIVIADAAATAGPEEMDRPLVDAQVLARFELR